MCHLEVLITYNVRHDSAGLPPNMSFSDLFQHTICHYPIGMIPLFRKHQARFPAKWKHFVFISKFVKAIILDLHSLNVTLPCHQPLLILSLYLIDLLDLGSLARYHLSCCRIFLSFRNFSERYESSWICNILVFHYLVLRFCCLLSDLYIWLK